MFIYIVATGNVQKRLLLASAKNIKEVFSFDVRISDVPVYYRDAYDPNRGQFIASKILNRMKVVELPNMLKLVGITDVDIYEDNLNFVFGIGELDGRCALVSTYRLFHKDERVFFERVFKEINHELGHTFGLLHCKTPGCVMNFSNSVFEVDQKSKNFCLKCKSKL
ncbi:archaemetzincin family Zn-dependent metalloprotease [Thermocrinis sp.]|uniref:archaemetzincin family Zn-dependent metalloprotease n=1 Tax=Thermocrinis sp. TaxID=2024383 RepID=UPI002FDD65E7